MNKKRGLELNPSQSQTGYNGLQKSSQGNVPSTPDIQIEDKVGLKKNIGFLQGVVVVAGTMIGSGIFVSPKGVTAGSGSVGLSLVSWFICGLIAIGGGLCYSELGVVVPESGAEYAYIKRGYGRLLAFLVNWTSIIMTKPASIAIITFTCAEYITVFFFSDGCGRPPLIITKLVAICIIVVLSVLNCRSMYLTNLLSRISCFGKVIALIVIIIGGFVRIGQGHTSHFTNAFDNTESNPGLIAIGLYNGLWAYDGWCQLSFITEEMKDPQKTLPPCILTGVGMVTVLYLLTNLSYFTVMSPQELLASPAVAVTWAQTVMPSVVWFIPVSVIISTFGAANITIMSNSRAFLVAARDHMMPGEISMVHVRHYTPAPSVILLSILAIIWTTPGNVGVLVDYFSFSAWTAYGLSMVSVIIFRVKLKHVKRRFKVPLVLPVVMGLVAAFLVIMPVVQAPMWQHLYAFLAVLMGLLFYVPFVQRRWVIPGHDRFTTALQLFLQVAPSPDFEMNN